MALPEADRARTPIGEMVLYDNNVIVHTLDTGAVVTAEAAEAVLEITAALAGDRNVAVVVDIRRVAFADHSSREVFARDPSGGVEVATGLVAGAQIANYLAGQFVNTAQPERPTAVFDDVATAIEWAEEQLRRFADA